MKPTIRGIHSSPNHAQIVTQIVTQIATQITPKRPKFCPNRDLGIWTVGRPDVVRPARLKGLSLGRCY